MDTNNRLRSIWNGLTSCGRNAEFVDHADLKTFADRIANEGAEFYARGFTSLRASLLTGLESGQLVWNTQAFKKRKGTLLPQFLYRAWCAIFNDCGTIRDIVSVDAVSCLNQLLAVFGKIEGGHTAASEKQVIETFQKNERELVFWEAMYEILVRHRQWPKSDADAKISREKWIANGVESFTRPEQIENLGQPKAEWVIPLTELDFVIRDARSLICRVLQDVNPLDITPSHGSGVSACHTPVRERYGKPRYIKAIDDIWPYSEYFFSGASHLCDCMPGRTEVPGQQASHVWLDCLEEYNPCAEVLLVPKDARGPRLISCEPRETMWIQQGLLPEIVNQVESHSLTKGLVNFTDQSINQWQAYRGSITRDTATLDLKDASDLNPLALVELLFPENWVKALKACRSGKTKLPDGTLVELRKFAPMGSALCFPIMALTIWSLLTAAANAAQTARAVRVSGALQKGRKAFNWCKPVYVYGDDIIVPSDFAETAQLVLRSVGFKVNVNKSFVHGSFRESCGGEFYNGWNVTPVRLRTLPTDDIPSRMRLIAFHNNCYEKYGEQPYWLTDLVHSWHPRVPERSMLRRPKSDPDIKLLLIHNPDSPVNASQLHIDRIALSGVLNVYRADNQRIPKRYRARYNRTEYRYLGIIPQGVKYPTDRWSQVFRSLVNPRKDMVLGWDALAKRVAYKYRWAPLS